jgi:hypothetical protein
MIGGSRPPHVLCQECPAISQPDSGRVDLAPPNGLEYAPLTTVIPGLDTRIDALRVA